MDFGTFPGILVSPATDLGVVTVTFNAPDRLNALTYATKRDLVEVLLQLQMDDRCRVIVFTGAGRAFVAGDDIVTTRPGDIAEAELVPPIPIGHTHSITTYEALRGLSQALTSLTFDQALDGIATKTAITDVHPDATAGAIAFAHKSVPRFNVWLEQAASAATDTAQS